MRTFILGLVVLLTVLFLISSMAEMQELLAVMRRADPVRLLAAALLQGVWFLCAAQSNRLIYARLGLRETFLAMLRLHTAATFIGDVTPSGGMSALAVFLTNARRRGHPAGRVLVGTLLYLLCEYMVLLVFVGSALAIMRAQNLLQGIEVAAAALLALLTAAMLLAIIVGARAPNRLARLMAALARGLNRMVRPFRRRTIMDEAQARRLASDLSSGSAVLHGNWPRTLIPPLAFAAIGRLLQIAMLALVFQSFDIALDRAVLLGAFGLSQLFVIISPTPAGIGIVEGAMTVALRALGLRVEAAAVVALTFRGITFWIPFAIGFLAFHHFSHRPGAASPADPLASGDRNP